MIKFSITIPAFKKKFLKKCIDSVLKQSYSGFELIIVNDASPEDLDNVVNLFNDARIRYYKNEKNFGAIDVVDNWNKCLSYATGDYLICMGDDDMLAEDALETYVRLIEKYPEVSLFHSRVKRIDENDQFIELTDVRPEYESVLSLIWYRMSYRQQYIGDFLFKTETLRSVGGFYKFPYAWASDDVSSYLVAEKNGVVNTNKPTFLYRCNCQTITMSGNAEVKMQALLLTDEWYKKFTTNYIARTEEETMLQTMIMQNLNKYSLRQKNILLMKDLYQRNGMSILKWLRVRKKYNLSFALLVFSFISFLKMKKVGAKF